MVKKELTRYFRLFGEGEQLAKIRARDTIFGSTQPNGLS
jgi:hypothetical protein